MLTTLYTHYIIALRISPYKRTIEYVDLSDFLNFT